MGRSGFKRAMGHLSLFSSFTTAHMICDRCNNLGVDQCFLVNLSMN